MYFWQCPSLMQLHSHPLLTRWFVLLTEEQVTQPDSLWVRGLISKNITLNTNAVNNKYLDLDMSHYITLEENQNPGDTALGEVSGEKATNQGRHGHTVKGLT